MNPAKSTTRKLITSLLAIVFCVQSLTAATLYGCHCQSKRVGSGAQTMCCCCSASHCSSETCCCCDSPSERGSSEESRVHCQCRHQPEPAVPHQNSVVTFNWSTLLVACTIESALEAGNSRLAFNFQGETSCCLSPAASVQVLCCVWLT